MGLLTILIEAVSVEFWHLGLKMDCTPESLLPFGFLCLAVPPTHPVKPLLFQLSLQIHQPFPLFLLSAPYVLRHMVTQLHSLSFHRSPSSLALSHYLLSPASSPLVARWFLCSVCINLHLSWLCGVSAGLLIKSHQLMTAFIPHLAASHPRTCLPASHNPLLVREWRLPVSAGCLSVVCCWGWGNRWSATFPLQRVSVTKCSVMQDGLQQ